MKMVVSMDLGDAITYPTENDDWIVTVLIGGVLSLLGILLIPYFLVWGYIVRVMRDRVGGAGEPPTFGDWGDLAVDGVQAFVILLVYQLIPLIVLFVLGGGSLAAMMSGSRGAAGAGMAGLFGAFALYVVLSILFSYVGTAGLVNFAVGDSIADGFDFGTITDVITDGDWVMAWVYVIVLGIGMSIVVGILSLIPFIGAIVGVFIAFYFQISFAGIWADGYSDALGGAA